MRFALILALLLAGCATDPCPRYLAACEPSGAERPGPP